MCCFCGLTFGLVIVSLSLLLGAVWLVYYCFYVVDVGESLLVCLLGYLVGVVVCFVCAIFWLGGFWLDLGCLCNLFVIYFGLCCCLLAFGGVRVGWCCCLVAVYVCWFDIVGTLLFGYLCWTCLFGFCWMFLIFAVIVLMVLRLICVGWWVFVWIVDWFLMLLIACLFTWDWLF